MKGESEQKETEGTKGSAREWLRERLLKHFRGTKMQDWPILASDEDCEQKKREVLETRGIMLAVPASVEPEICAEEWTLLFETEGGACHPLRVRFVESVTLANVVRYARDYLDRNAWLRGLLECYPTNPTEGKEAGRE